MKKGMDLVELAKTVQGMKDEKKDFVLPSRMLKMDEQTGAVAFGERAFTPTIVLHEQLSEKLQIPKKYYDRMKEQEPALLARNVNAWLERSEDLRMLRTVGNNARALLSDRYRPLDNDMILEAVLPILFEHRDMQVISADLTERHLYIQVVTPRLSGDVVVGDTVQAGLTISNSEVGLGSVRVEPLLYRLSCLNGAIMATALRKNHVGKSIEADGGGGFYATETIEADNTAFLLKIRDTVKNGFDEIAFFETLKRVQFTAGNRLAAKPVQDVVEDVTARFDLSKVEADSVLKSFIEGRDLTQWGLANAITATANNVPDYERSVELMRAGGKVIDLSPGDWKTLVN